MSAGKGDVIKFSEIQSLKPNSYKTQYLEEMTRYHPLNVLYGNVDMTVGVQLY